MGCWTVGKDGWAVVDGLSLPIGSWHLMSGYSFIFLCHYVFVAASLTLVNS